MSKIINFPSVGQCPGQQIKKLIEQPVYSLADLAESAMDTAQSQNFGVVSHGSVEPFTFKEPEHLVLDWSNQELASLYRAQRLLNLTGISFDTDRGLSDENDPWFVFLDDAEQVLAHFCRIDGLYHFDSAAQSKLLTAPTLEALVGSFARRHEGAGGVAMPRDDVSQVIDFNSSLRTKVLMHPGVSLAALIWSVYVLSDSLILPTRDQDGEDPVVSNSATGHPENITLSILPVEAHPHSVAVANIDTVTDFRDTNANGLFPSLGSGSSSVMNLVSWGLGTLSLVYGLHQWVLLTSNAPSTQEALATMATINAKGSDEMSADIERFISDLSDGAKAFLDLRINQDERRDVAPEVTTLISNIIDDAQNLLGELKAPLLIIEKPQVDTVKVSSISDITEASYAFDVEKVVVDTSQDMKNMPLPSLSKWDLLQLLSDADIIETTKIDVFAQSLSFEDSPFVYDAFEERQIYYETSTFAEETVTILIHTLFDQAAHDFITFLLMKDEDPKRSAYNGEIVLIDMAAFDGIDGGAYARSWSFEDGSVLSTVGLKSDYEAFGLVI
jgi:hypothetical protein